jgi:cell division protein WhiA
MSLTRRLRDELSGIPHPGTAARLAETSALLRFGGAWTVRDSRIGWVLDTGVPAVLRRAHRSLTELSGVRSDVEAHEPGGLAAHTSYRLRVWDGDALAACGLVDDAGHPLPAVPDRVLAGQQARTGYLRGALMAAGGLSGPGQAPHLEIRAPSGQAAEQLESVLRALGVAGVRPGTHGQGWRLVGKSGEDIAAVLALAGAHGTYLAFDEGRLRRQLRGEATRAANADRANVGRAVTASARQVRLIQGLLAGDGWGDLAPDLQEVALARLANPQASITELAGLLGRTRTTVHRRLLRLEQEAASADTGWVASGGGDGPPN